MSLFTRSQKRAQPLTFTPYNVGSTRTLSYAAGQAVSPDTAGQKVAFAASVDLIATLLSTMPVRVQRLRNGVMVDVPKSPVLLDPEGLGYGLEDFTYKWAASIVPRGNVFCDTGPLDSTGRPTVVALLDPNRVTPTIADGVVKLRLPDGTVRPFHSPTEPTGIKHARSHAVPGQVLGESVVAKHARTLGLALASEQFGADFFGDGAHPTGILSSDAAVITDEQAKTVRERWMAMLSGNREPAVLGSGLKYEQVQINPEESQFLETQGYTDAQICRMFGPAIAETLGYKTGNTLTYANVQSQFLHLLTATLNPWVVRYERFLSDYLLAPDEVATIDRNVLLAMTATDRWSVYKTQAMLGAATINELRAAENQPPVEWGDEPWLPAFLSAAAMVTQQAEVVPPEGKTP